MDEHARARLGQAHSERLHDDEDRALVALIGVGLLVGWNPQAVSGNFGDLWTPRGAVPLAPGLDATTAYGMFIALCVAQVGSLFSADAWNNITFTAGEVKDPRRNIPLALALGT